MSSLCKPLYVFTHVCKKKGNSSNDYTLCVSKVTILCICKKHSTSEEFESAVNAITEKL